MKDSLQQQSCADFTAALAARTPTPGGGGAAALAGALGAALCAMVGHFTTGKPKYAAYEDDLHRLLKEAEAIRIRLLALMDEDAAAFAPLSAAYALSKDDPRRGEAVEAAAQNACTAPLEILRQTCRAVALLEEMLDKGSVLLLSDVGCGAELCKAALQCAALNIFVNTGSLKNRAVAAKLEAEADALRAACLPRADAVAREVERRIRGAV